MTLRPSNLTSFLRRKERLSGQLAKYVLCGGAAVAVDNLVFYLLAWLVFPCLRASDPAARLIEWAGFAVREVGEAELTRNYWIIKGICFLLVNSVVYVLNVLFVFQAGRHRRPVEILLFFCTSLFQLFFIWLGGVLIAEFHWEVTYSNATMLLVSVIGNFLLRKKVVFKY